MYICIYVFILTTILTFTFQLFVPSQQCVSATYNVVGKYKKLRNVCYKRENDKTTRRCSKEENNMSHASIDEQ